MQLRVARLCLDCEELHVDNNCPRCASERYAFLSRWLPSEERRRWRRPATGGSSGGNAWSSHGPARLARALGRWFWGDKPDHVHVGPTTRASDHVPQLLFDNLKDEPATRTALDVRLSKHDVR
jgi:hypothetical protein